MKSVRKKLVNGEKIAECEACYTLEDSKACSDRITANDQWLTDFHDFIEASVKNDFEVQGPKHLDLRVGNVCNLKCQSCFPSLSVGLYDDILEVFEANHDIRPAPDHSRKLDPGFSLNQLEDVMEDIEVIKLVGGEPLLSRHANELITRLVESGKSKNTAIDLHTNLTIWKEDIIEKLLQFKSVRIGLSIDGVASVNEYMRYPSRWTDVDGSLKKYIQLAGSHAHLEARVTPVVQMTNSFSITDLIWYLVSEVQVIEHGVFLEHIFLTDPAFYSLVHAPVVFKELARDHYMNFLESLQAQQLDYIEPLSNDLLHLLSSPEDLEETKKYLTSIRLYEKYRPHGIRAVFPQVELLEQNWKPKMTIRELG